METSTLVENMVAFSMVSSSTPTDVLRHFHHVRLEAIVKMLENPVDTKDSVVKALKLYVKTLQDTQTIFPKRLSEALARLRDFPLLRDRDVQDVQELKLDVHERWIADEVRKYTPYPRQDDLKKPEAEKLLKVWAKQALKAYLDGLRTVLKARCGLVDAVVIRKELLETCNSSNIRVPGVRVSDILDDLRDVLNDTLKQQINTRADTLSNVSNKVADVLKNWQSESTDAPISLWASETTALSFADGATSFKLAILDRSHGRNTSITSVIESYEDWAKSIEEIHLNLREMKELRWDDEISDVEEDDEELESKQVLLSEDDPKELEDTLTQALEARIKSLVSKLDELIRNLPSDSAEGLAGRSRFLLRTIRELSTRAQALSLKSTSSIVSLSPSLHKHLADDAKLAACSAYQESLKRVKKSRTVAAEALWEGSPPLPVQPSPGSFKFLKVLNATMTSAGADLWTRNAVNVLKKACDKELFGLINAFLEDVDNEPVIEATPAVDVEESVGKELEADKLKKEEEKEVNGDGDGEAEKKEEQSAPTEAEAEDRSLVKSKKLAQLLFDILYLQRALSISAESGPLSLEGLLAQVQKRASLDDAALERLSKSALDYWKKTYLLFALLA